MQRKIIVACAGVAVMFGIAGLFVNPPVAEQAEAISGSTNGEVGYRVHIDPATGLVVAPKPGTKPIPLSQQQFDGYDARKVARRRRTCRHGFPTPAS